jgi:hypothetical protein
MVIVIHVIVLISGLGGTGVPRILLVKWAGCQRVYWQNSGCLGINISWQPCFLGRGGKLQDI